jgi:hypothetical protein
MAGMDGVGRGEEKTGRRKEKEALRNVGMSRKYHVIANVLHRTQTSPSDNGREGGHGRGDNGGEKKGEDEKERREGGRKEEGRGRGRKAAAGPV